MTTPSDNIPTAEEHATWKVCGICGYRGPCVMNIGRPDNPDYRCHGNRDQPGARSGCLPALPAFEPEAAPLELGEVVAEVVAPPVAADELGALVAKLSPEDRALLVANLTAHLSGN